jgi:hypothetical protein
MRATIPLLIIAGACWLAGGCSKETSPTSSGTDTTGTNNGADTTKKTTDLPPGYEKFNSSVHVYVDGDYVVIQTNDIPDHKSPYFATTDSRYEAYNGSNPKFRINPNRIREQNMTFRIPRHPVLDPQHQETPLGAIGVALNGVAIFNQYAAQRMPLTDEINSFDQYDGHPQQQGAYHYHAEPFYLTANKGKDALLGFLLDGFPVYGPQENGKTVTNADLDEYHGHFGATAEYPEGIYHYHVTAEDPYINGNGFYGAPGTVSQ